MTRDKDPEVIARRKKMCALRFRGMSVSKVAENLAESYDLTEDYIAQDWYRRKNWLPDLFDVSLDDVELQ